MAQQPRNSIGARLRRERDKRGWTQREVAEHMHMTTSSITQYETNHHRPPLDIMEALARLFEVPVEYLLRGDAPPPARKIEEARTPTELQVLSLFRRTPEAAHAGMLAVLKATLKYSGASR
jgi:transcriptional regulator with XRE-family HTH domain